LPIETVSGLSEPGHAGGAFPRPDLHERLGRLLEKAKPGLIVACYGMNDGIYYPFGEERFQKFEDGIRRLRERAAAAGVQVIHVTPPTFDAVPLQGRTLPAGLAEYRSPYEAIMKCSTIIRMTAENAARLRGGRTGPIIVPPSGGANPKFLLAADGVHANTQDIGSSRANFCSPGRLITSCPPMGSSGEVTSPEPMLKLVQRQRLLKDAWLSSLGTSPPA
jgi:hypothetical protein